MTSAVHSLGQFALHVPNLDDARQFFEAFGLAVAPEGETLAVRALDGHVCLRIFPGERKALAYMSFHCYAEDYVAIRRQIEAAGAVIPDDAPFADGEGIWFLDPDRNLVQVKIGPKTSPGKQTLRDATRRAAGGRIQPHRLSHIFLFTPDVPRALVFYETALGLRLSDRSGDNIAFTHGPHGSDHHMLAFAKSAARGWHHAGWDVAHIDDVARGAAQMAAAGYAEGWGTGRHLLGSGVFHYVRDPWGSFHEYLADMDYIAPGQPWHAADFPPEESFSKGAPVMPADFIQNTEI